MTKSVTGCLFQVLTLCCAVVVLLPPCSAEDVRIVDGDMRIHAPAGDSEIVITTTSRLAGAIHSLMWNHKEFINSADHGRQLQSASNLNVGDDGLAAETFNPTEAGSRRDGAGSQSSSRLLHKIAIGNRLQTCTQMAFWLAPDEKSGGLPAKNTTILSNHLLTKRVRIGYRDLPHVIQYDVTFGLPVDERHTLVVFEVLTGYMPPEFSSFKTFNPKTEQLEPLSDGPGEQALPIVLATEDGQYAMGCYSPDQFGTTWNGPSYGRFKFQRERVVKWNCVFRNRATTAVPPGDYSFRVFVVVGDEEIVRDSLARLHQIHAATGP